jgi:hypothetical protein
LVASGFDPAAFFELAAEVDQQPVSVLAIEELIFVEYL